MNFFPITSRKVFLVAAVALSVSVVSDYGLQQAHAKVQEYIRRGCTCPILYPVGGDVRLLIDTFTVN